MRNAHSARCYRCGKHCKPGDGHVEIVTDVQRAKWPDIALPKWLVQHAECALKYRGTKVHYKANPDAPVGATDEVMSGSELSAILPSLAYHK